MLLSFTMTQALFKSELIMEQEHSKSGSGVFKVLGTGCLVVIVVTGIIGFVAWQKYQSMGGLQGLIQAGGDKAVEAVVGGVAEGMLAGLKIPEQQRKTILKPLRDLSEKITSGQLEVDQLEDIAKTLTDGPMLGVLLAEGFAHSYLQSSDLTGAQMQQALLTINRYQQGFVNQTIDLDSLAKLEHQVLDELSSNHYQLKNTLTSSELRASLAVMQQAADQAGIPMQSVPIDIAGMLQGLIEAALARAN